MTAPTSSRDLSPEAFEPPRLNESPAVPPPRRSGRPLLVVHALRAWRQLTSMRTALILLFLLALAAIPGSLIPQRELNPIKVEEY
nr:cytochrome c biogenesis protein ResB [Micromonospora sp. DSM 115978]